MIGEVPASRAIKLVLRPNTQKNSTTRAGLLTSPLRDRFGIVRRLEFYRTDDLVSIVQRSATILNLAMEREGATELDRRYRRRTRHYRGRAGTLSDSAGLSHAHRARPRRDPSCLSAFRPARGAHEIA